MGQLENRTLAIVAFLIASLGPSTSMAQYVSTSYFCKNVQSNKCINQITGGSTVPLSSLRLVKNEDTGKYERRIYFWARLKSETDVEPVIYMALQGSCYDQEPEVKLEGEPGFARTGGAYVYAVGVNLLSSLEISGSLGPGKISIKQNPLEISKDADRYRVHDFRSIQCPGTLRAVLTDSENRPLPGDNKVRILTIK